MVAEYTFNEDNLRNETYFIFVVIVNIFQGICAPINLVLFSCLCRAYRRTVIAIVCRSDDLFDGSSVAPAPPLVP